MDTAKGRDRKQKVPFGRPLPERSLPRILDRIRRDAVVDPAEYLKDAEAPSGGE